jgi:ABC-type Na+ efflux pump permease subunit
MPQQEGFFSCLKNKGTIIFVFILIIISIIIVTIIITIAVMTMLKDDKPKKKKKKIEEIDDGPSLDELTKELESINQEILDDDNEKMKEDLRNASFEGENADEVEYSSSESVQISVIESSDDL